MKRIYTPLSYFYRLVSQLKNWLYSLKLLRPSSAPLPVISVGNITFGGSEKTPLVINLASTLLQKGYKPAVLTRGYKGKWEKKGGILSDGFNIRGSWKEAGDEPLMLAQNIPQAGVFIGKNRLVSCLKAKKMGFNVAILDDGFQHRKLYRDLDIVLLNPILKSPLREPFNSLKRAHIILLKNNFSLTPEEKSKLNKKFPDSFLLDYSVISCGFYDLKKREKVPSYKLKNKKVVSFCGIAHPERFHSLLQKEGITLVASLTFPDHYFYPPSSFQKIREIHQKINPQALVTTEKDAVKIAKCPQFHNLPVFYLKIDLKLNLQLYSEVLSVLKRTGFNAHN